MLNTFGPKTSCEEEAKFMQQRVQDTDKKLTLLCDVFSQYAVTTAKIRDKSDKLGKTTLEISKNEIINPSLAEGLCKFGENMLSLGDYGDLRAKTIESKIVQDFAKYGEFCKSNKKAILTIVAAKDREYTSKRQFERIKGRNTVNRQQILQAEQDTMKASANLKKTIHTVEERVEQLEQEKIHDIKSILLDFISLEIGYHAKAIEVLSQAFNNVENIDEMYDLEEFKKSLLASSKLPEPSPPSEPRSSFFRPSQSLGSIAAIFSNPHRKRDLGIPHAKLPDKTIDSKRGIDSGSATTSSGEENKTSEELEENSDYYLKSVEDISSEASFGRESVDISPFGSREDKNKLKVSSLRK